jgi:hypothetical protein
MDPFPGESSTRSYRKIKDQRPMIKVKTGKFSSGDFSGCNILAGKKDKR